MPRIIILMGVSGCGKTTIGKLLAETLKLPFFDGDDFHPMENIDKMKNNIALTDYDRAPWLETLAMQIKNWSTRYGAVLTCSALKESYRDMISQHYKTIDWVYLYGRFETIKSRLECREQHYMKSVLLQSQFDTLEEPSYGLHINIEDEKETIVNDIIVKLKANV